MKDPAFEEPEEQLYKENICAFIREHEPEIVLIGATSLGRSLGPRIAAALRTGLTADCTQLQISDGRKRPRGNWNRYVRLSATIF